ncbi:Predicted DNA-binding transcriptional regulator YafY, contains an HTH and WYL domains [Pseudovibrio denitrificans]|uniref:Predicted DNA-binding transcriptional regulator YafY, contains an HTH and WYL domains n=1 Tax=Pseudovibrio denitrificans TaxID=258256 RepID=A0A1I7DWU9_9HYPH|nr:WYL domain-containing protein [Pseudovibrio denitrificans]SFU16106.1 Predicted DNA-binding transcriptional regulator YafY, contains an HTH and WYL domains [Pseudovibrio denitrificans]
MATERTRATALERLDRLEQIEMLLKSGECPTTHDLAKELGVSQRTLFRDLELLRERGLPIEADKGRGGGIRLQSRWGVGRLKLEYKEAIDLLISLAIAESMRSPLLLANLKPIRRKLIASFSPELRSRVDTLKSRIWIGGTASVYVYGSFEEIDSDAMSPINEAFLMSKCIQIEYSDQNGNLSQRTIEPHYLFLSYPVWYIMAWDHLRNAVRTFRLDRIKSAQMLEKSFPLKPKHPFIDAIDGIEPTTP